ncbi:hypothetical protein O0L34_g6349 [Tuta absoluta]|nr:hypothetical protein O0L34_g6349 [Tuta absoluta]
MPRLASSASTSSRSSYSSTMTSYRRSANAVAASLYKYQADNYVPAFARDEVAIADTATLHHRPASSSGATALIRKLRNRLAETMTSSALSDSRSSVKYRPCFVSDDSSSMFSYHPANYKPSSARVSAARSPVLSYRQASSVSASACSATVDTAMLTYRPAYFVMSTPLSAAAASTMLNYRMPSCVAASSVSARSARIT